VSSFEQFQNVIRKLWFTIFDLWNSAKCESFFHEFAHPKRGHRKPPFTEKYFDIFSQQCRCFAPY